MAWPPEKKTAVKRSYIYQRQTLEQCARLHKVPIATIKSWKTKDAKNGQDWDSHRTAARLASGPVGELTEQIIEEFMIMFNATVTAIKDDKKLTSLDKAEAVASLSDSYIKITKAATTMSPRLHKITVALEVIKDYTDMVYQEFPQLAGPVIETLEHFANLVQEKYG